MSEAIKHVLGLQGWEEIKGVFTEEVINARKLIDVPASELNKLTDAQIGQLTRARKEAGEIVLKALRRVERLGSMQPIEKKSYK